MDIGCRWWNHYTFRGPGLTGEENDPTLYLMRGQKYKFINNMGKHPFRIQSTQMVQKVLHIMMV